MRPSSFYAVDPGLAKVGGSGWALFVHERLLAAGVLRNHKSWLTMGQRIRGQGDLFREVRMSCGLYPVVAEHMIQIYKVPAQDLIDLQTLAGFLGNAWVKPSAWKGGVKRDVEQTRSRCVLSPEEKIVVDEACSKLPKSIHKEVTSAVGIGLSVAGRAHKKCGWPE
jgi:hypothetical protein